MSTGNKIKKGVVLEIVKWSSIILLCVILIIVSYMYHDYNTYIKNVAVLIVMCIITCVLMTTRLGKVIVIFGKESYLELQKVVWPTYQDSLNTTAVVVAVTIILSLILWGLDTILVQVISFGLRF